MISISAVSFGQRPQAQLATKLAGRSCNARAGGLGLGAQSQRSGGYLRGDLIGRLCIRASQPSRDFGELEAPMPAAPSAHWCGIPPKIATTSPVSRLLGVRACSSREVGPPRHRAARLWTRTAAPAAPSHPNWPGYRVFERPVGAGLARTAVSSTRISRLGQSDARQGPVGGQEPEVRPSQRSADLVTARRPAPPARPPAPACPPRCRSGFGHQCTSNKPSSPGFGFGSSGRDAFQKVARRAGRGWPLGGVPVPSTLCAPPPQRCADGAYPRVLLSHTRIHALHPAALPAAICQRRGGQGQGEEPGRRQPAGRGVQRPGKSQASPHCLHTIGRAALAAGRPNLHLKSLAPAPAQCPHFSTQTQPPPCPPQSTIEKQVTSDLPSPPKVSFGTSSRPPLCSPTAAPGPGAYKLKPALGECVQGLRGRGVGSGGVGWGGVV